MKLVSADLMRQVDHLSIDRFGVPAEQLMESAGRGIADTIADCFHDHLASGGATIVAGKGNNGGDGYVVARYLAEQNISVEVLYLGPIDRQSLESQQNFQRLVASGVIPKEIKSAADLPPVRTSGVVVDALLGTGSAGRASGLVAEIIEWINLCDSIIVSIDIPSGLMPDTGEAAGPVVEATLTCTLGLPKLGLYLSPGRECAGDVEIVPIGLADEAVEMIPSPIDLMTLEEMSELLPFRPPTGHKGTFGRLLVVAGSRGMVGAAVLCARAALRSGCGLVQIAAAESLLPIITPAVPEATIHPLPEVRGRGVIALRALGELRRISGTADAIAIGPGLSLHRETTELVRRFLKTIERPIVIDADGINALSPHESTDLPIWPADQTPVLTPHLGEFRRLVGEAIPESFLELLELARRHAQRLSAVCLVKGSPSFLVDPAGHAALCPTGNDGMATGGSGDVLTGIIGSLLAQGLPAREAATLGCYLHSLAGDFARERQTARGMIASDIIASLGDAFRELDEPTE